jgi:hypothetical protein
MPKLEIISDETWYDGVIDKIKNIKLGSMNDMMWLKIVLFAIIFILFVWFNYKRIFK